MRPLVVICDGAIFGHHVRVYSIITIHRRVANYKAIFEKRTCLNVKQGVYSERL